MIEQIEHIKKFALQDNSALSVKQLGEAIARMCDDAIREAVEHSVQSDPPSALASLRLISSDGQILAEWQPVPAGS